MARRNICIDCGRHQVGVPRRGTVQYGGTRKQRHRYLSLSFAIHSKIATLELRHMNEIPHLM